MFVIRMHGYTVKNDFENVPKRFETVEKAEKYADLSQFRNYKVIPEDKQ